MEPLEQPQGGPVLSNIDVVVRLLAQNKDFKRTLQESRREADSFAGRAADGFRSMARPAAIAGGAVAAMGGLSVKSFVGFDDAMNQSLSIMGDVSATMRGDMARAARDMATQTRFSANQAAESYFFLASAGLDAEQSMAALPTVAGFAQAGMFDMATATDLLTDAQSALGLASKDTAENMRGMTRVSDVVVKANTLANASVQQFGEALQVAAPSAKQLGMDVEELTALLAVMADRGIKGAEAGTALAFTLPQLTDRARKNSEAWAEQGIAIFDAEGQMRSMADIIEDLGTATEGMTAEQRDATISALGLDGRMGRTIKTFIGAEDQLRSYESALRDAGGTTEEIAEKQLSSPAAKFDLMKSRLMDLSLSMGEAFLPAVLAMGDALEPLLGFLIQHSEVAIGLVATIGALAATVLIVNGAMKAWAAITVIAKGATLAWTAAQWLLNAALTANPIGLVIVAIAALIAAAVLIVKNWDLVRDTTLAAWSVIKDKVMGALAFLTGAFFKWHPVGIFIRKWDDIKAVFSRAKTIFFGIGREIMNGLKDGIKSLATGPVDAVKDAGKGIVSGAKNLLGISSPSRVFMDIGEDITRGMEQGLDSFDSVLPDPMAGLDSPRIRSGGNADRGMGRVEGLLQRILERLGETSDGRVLLDGREVGRVLDEVRGQRIGRWEVDE